MLRVLPPPLPLLPLSASSLRSSSSSLSKQLPALLPLLVVVVRYYFLRLLFFFPFCLHAGVREAERNEGTRSVSAYSTRSFLSASCVLRPREREREKNVASIGIARNRKEFDFLKSMIFGSREKKTASIPFPREIFDIGSCSAHALTSLASREEEWGDSRIYFERELDNRVALVCDSNSSNFFRSRDLGISESQAKVGNRSIHG